MSFEQPQRKTPDAEIRDLRRTIEAQPGDMQAQEALNRALERKGIIRRQVPVEVSHPADEVGPQQPPEQRWVEWKRAYNEQGVEIPGSIEKILVVNLLDLSIDELIAAGHYNNDWLSGELTDADRAASRLTGPRELLLPKFERTVTTAEIEEWFKQNDLLGATLQELLTIGAQFPAEQRSAYLFALDEAWRSRGRVPVLDEDLRVRHVSSRDRDLLWYQFARPVAARKYPQPLGT